MTSDYTAPPPQWPQIGRRSVAQMLDILRDMGMSVALDVVARKHGLTLAHAADICTIYMGEHHARGQ